MWGIHQSWSSSFSLSLQAMKDKLKFELQQPQPLIPRVGNIEIVIAIGIGTVYW